MTVEQLIAELSKGSPDTMVYIVHEDSSTHEIESAYAVGSVSEQDKNGLAFLLESTKS